MVSVPLVVGQDTICGTWDFILEIDKYTRIEEEL